MADINEEYLFKIFEDFGIILNGEDIALTAGTIDDFLSARSKWTEKGVLETGTYKGHDYAYIERAQIRKGTARGDVIIIDIGDQRAVYSDLTIR